MVGSGPGWPALPIRRSEVPEIDITCPGRTLWRRLEGTRALGAPGNEGGNFDLLRRAVEDCGVGLCYCRDMGIKRLDHVSVVVDDLAAAIAFFTALGMTFEGETPVEGPWVGCVNALDSVQVDIVMDRAVSVG
jgi:hypothetical protein